VIRIVGKLTTSYEFDVKNNLIFTSIYKTEVNYQHVYLHEFKVTGKFVLHKV